MDRDTTDKSTLSDEMELLKVVAARARGDDGDDAILKDKDTLAVAEKPVSGTKELPENSTKKALEKTLAESTKRQQPENLTKKALENEIRADSKKMLGMEHDDHKKTNLRLQPTELRRSGGAPGPSVPQRPGAYATLHAVPEPPSSQRSLAAASPESPTVTDALLVQEPPKDFTNTQVCMSAVDGGGGWAACKSFCAENATFTCQSDTMGHMTTIQEYADFMAGFGKACPNPRWTVDAEHWDGTTNTATFFCTYYCQHTVSVEGVGPAVPTQRHATSHYCCKVTTDPDQDHKVVHITKCWNDVWMLRELGWLAEAVPASKEDGDRTASSTAVDVLEGRPSAPEAKESKKNDKRRSILRKLKKLLGKK